MPCWVSAIFTTTTKKHSDGCLISHRNIRSVRLFCGHIKHSRESNTAIWLKKLRSHKMKKAHSLVSVDGFCKHTHERMKMWLSFFFFSSSSLLVSVSVRRRKSVAGKPSAILLRKISSTLIFSNCETRKINFPKNAAPSVKIYYFIVLSRFPSLLLFYFMLFASEQNSHKAGKVES